MSAIVEEGRKLRPPSNMKEAAALGVAVVLGLGFVQLSGPLVRSLTFVDEAIRGYVGGLGIAAIWPLYEALKRAFDRAGGDGLVRPDLPPWFATGTIAAALLYAWTQFTCILGVLAVSAAFKNVQGVQGGVVGALSAGALLVALPMTAVAAFVAGALLNRNTRTAVVAALALAAAGFGALNLATAFLFLGRRFLVSDTLGAAVTWTAIVFVFGAVGVFTSSLLRDRSIGRLTHAARRLTPYERDAVTEGVMRRIESRGK